MSSVSDVVRVAHPVSTIRGEIAVAAIPEAILVRVTDLLVLADIRAVVEGEEDPVAVGVERGEQVQAGRYAGWVGAVVRDRNPGRAEQIEYLTVRGARHRGSHDRPDTCYVRRREGCRDREVIDQGSARNVMAGA
jgi:hypothetical protein